MRQVLVQLQRFDFPVGFHSNVKENGTTTSANVSQNKKLKLLLTRFIASSYITLAARYSSRVMWQALRLDRLNFPSLQIAAPSTHTIRVGSTQSPVGRRENDPSLITTLPGIHRKIRIFKNEKRTIKALPKYCPYTLA